MIFTIQLILYVLFGGCVAFLTWFGIGRVGDGGDDDDDDYHNMNPFFTVAAVAYVVALPSFGFISRHKLKGEFESISESFNPVIVGLYCYGMLIPGLVLMALSFKRNIQFDTYHRFESPIRNSLVEFDGNYLNCSKDHEEWDSCGAYRARLYVNWDCTSSIECDKWVQDKLCTIPVNSHSATPTSFSEHTEKVQKCLYETYGLPGLGPLEQSDFENLADWPKIEGYFSCSGNCDVKPPDTNMYTVRENIKLAGIIMSCLGGALFMYEYCKGAYEGFKKSRPTGESEDNDELLSQKGRCSLLLCNIVTRCFKSTRIAPDEVDSTQLSSPNNRVIVDATNISLDSSDFDLVMVDARILGPADE